MTGRQGRARKRATAGFPNASVAGLRLAPELEELQDTDQRTTGADLGIPMHSTPLESWTDGSSRAPLSVRHRLC
eukprot:6453307-Pyramimonas_sp.AAC.1